MDSCWSDGMEDGALQTMGGSYVVLRSGLWSQIDLDSSSGFAINKLCVFGQVI